MRTCVGVLKIRAKATWGSRVAQSAALMLVLALGVPGVAAADSKGKSGKLDKLLEKVTEKGGESDVIVEFLDDTDASTFLKQFGKPGKKLGIINGFTATIPNGLLKKLASSPKVKKVSSFRVVESFNGRTAVTVGARAVNWLMGYEGNGIGVAVIDSGVAAWHDDLTRSNRTGQRVVHFKDFVNGRTTAYDDWGHGTHVAGTIASNGYDSLGTRGGIAPKANIIALKALGENGRSTISRIIAAIDYAVSVKNIYNIRVINMSLGAGVYESYNTDPLTIAAKRAVEAGIVVVAAAGNMGRAANGQPQYGAISAPGNAPWVLTVGASSTEGTVDRRDDKIAPYSSRGPTMIDFAAKPDLVAPGTATVSLADKTSRMYIDKAQFLVSSLITPMATNSLGVPVLSSTFRPYLTLSGTSMAAPVVSGTVALMLEANPTLTPNLVKAILQFTAQVYNGYDSLTQGAGFLNSRGAVVLAEYFRTGHAGVPYPRMTGWSQQIIWGNRRVSGGVLTPGGTAWATNVVWGELHTPLGQNVVWGENCDQVGTCESDSVVWGNNVVWGNSTGDDNVVWSNTDGDNVVWGNGFDNIVWGENNIDNVVWGNAADNVVWGNDCSGANCDNVVWGNAAEDNVVWGNAEGIDNVVWGNSTDLTGIWGTSSDDNITWGNGTDDEPVAFGPDESEVDSVDITVWDLLFEIAFQEGGQQ
jgi:serine protease AprX